MPYVILKSFIIVQKLIGCRPAPFRLDLGERKGMGKEKEETPRTEGREMEMK